MMMIWIIVASGVNALTDSPPHLLYILVDDFGWANADWHRDDNFTEKATPFFERNPSNGWH